MQKTPLTFWSRWMMFLAFFLLVYGLAMVFVPEMMNQTFVAPLLFGNNDPLQSTFFSMGASGKTILNILSGLLGTVTLGWAVQIAWIAHIPFRNGEWWAWYALATSLCAWAVFEFYFKLMDGITGPGLVAHFGLLMAFAIPLLATFRHFHPVMSIQGESGGGS